MQFVVLVSLDVMKGFCYNGNAMMVEDSSVFMLFHASTAPNIS